MKKIFIALLLSAAGSSAWADVTYNFGSGSTWTVKCNGKNVDKATGLVVKVAKAGDLIGLKNSHLMYDANGNPDSYWSNDWNNKPNKEYTLQHVMQKDVVISGSLSEADLDCLYGGGEQNWTFCTAKTLNLTGISTSITNIDDIKSAWGQYAYCHGNSNTQGLVFPGSGDEGGSSSIQYL